MTMVPAENYLPKQHHLPNGGGGGFYGYCGSSYAESFGLMSRVDHHGYDFHESEACLGLIGSDQRMAEDESRTNSLNNEAAGSDSKDVNNNQQQQQQQHELERDEGWLQLSIGAQPTTTTTHDPNRQHDPTASRTGGLIELDLLSGGSSHSQQPRPLAPAMFHVPEFPFRPPPPSVMHSFSTSLFFQHQQGTSSMFPHYGDLSSSFRPMIAQNIAPPPPSASSSSSSSSFMPLGSYFARPFPMQPEMDVAGPSSEFKIIDPPRRPHSGIWFVLQASQNQ